MITLTPIVVAFKAWVKSLGNSLDSDRLDLICSLSKLIPILDKDGHRVMLDHLLDGRHNDTLERIRCLDDIPLITREKMVDYYMQFSLYLSCETYDFIPVAIDWDRELVRDKLIRYDDFISFVQYLPRRDALMAKLLYFGAPSMECVISLTRSRVLAGSIAYADGEFRLPRHVSWELKAYIKTLDPQEQLIFLNLRDGLVERSHLNQSFARACTKSCSTQKITPGALLKQNNEIRRLSV